MEESAIDDLTLARFVAQDHAVLLLDQERLAHEQDARGEEEDELAIDPIEIVAHVFERSPFGAHGIGRSIASNAS